MLSGWRKVGRVFVCGWQYVYISIYTYIYVCVQRQRRPVIRVCVHIYIYIYIYIYIHWRQINRLIGLVRRVFANGPVDLGSIPGRVIPKTSKMVLDTSLLNTQQYKVCIKGKVEKSRERSSALPDTSVYSLLKRETSGRPRLRSPTLLTNLFV